MPKQKPNEHVQQIPLSEIRPFKNHPFKVADDELMQQTIDIIMQVGVLNPAIIRPTPEGGYEMVASHRANGLQAGKTLKGQAPPGWETPGPSITISK